MVRKVVGERAWSAGLVSAMVSAETLRWSDAALGDHPPTPMPAGAPAGRRVSLASYAASLRIAQRVRRSLMI